MPPRKPFRPDKNRAPGRAQHGSRDAESGAQGGRRDNRSQAGRSQEKRSWDRERPRSEERAASPRHSAESVDSKPRREHHERSDEAASGYKASGGSYWIYGNHAVLAAIDNPKRRIRRLLQANAEAEK